MKNNSGWHVLYARSRHENKVYESLIDKGIEAFLPMTTVIRKWSDRKKKIKVPLFTSYVFVNIKSRMDFHKAANIDGACTFIRFGKEYAVVKEDEIEKIRFLTNMEGIKDLKSDSYLPKLGERVEISCGPLEGLTCSVIRVDDNYKIQVSIDSLKQSIYATVPSLFLNPLATA